MMLGLLSWCLSLGLHVAAPPGSAPPDATAVLSEWDEQRSAAWAEADPAALRALYTRSSTAGRTDVAMLRQWRARGLRVERLRMQRLSVRVVSSGPDRLEVRVTDRIAGGVVAPGGTALPRDAVTGHRIVLRRVDAAWLVASVRDQPRPARTTSWTVRSPNS